MSHRATITRLACVVALLLVGALLGGCGGAAAQGGGDEGREVVDARGRTVLLPAAVTAVATLSEPTTDAVLALGVVPVATTAARGQSDALAGYLPPEAAAIPVVGQLGTPDLEQLAALHPDLILTDGTATNDDTLIDQLQRIAPTLWVGQAGNTDWEAGLRGVAVAVDRVGAAEDYIANFEAASADVRDDLGANAGAQISIVRWGLTSGAFLPQSTFPAQVLTDLGLTRPAAQDVEGAGHSEQVSEENIDLLDGDWMFFCTLGGAAGPATAGDGGGSTGVQASADVLAETATQAVGFTELQVYRSGHIVPVDGSAWGSAGGPLAAWQILTDVQDNLTS